jgi:hypothetical protein
MHAQIFSENLVPHGFCNSNLFCSFTTGQMTTGTNHLPNFLYVIFTFWCWRLSGLFTVLDSILTLFSMFVPLMVVCSTHGFVHQTLIWTFWKSLKKVSLIWNKISHKHIPHDTHPFLNAEKFAEHARHVRTLRHTTQWRSILEWSGLWCLPKETYCYAMQPARLHSTFA